MDLHKYRNNYVKGILNEVDLPLNPLDLFRIWFDIALQTNVYDANAMVLSTVSGNKPSSRVVLLKELDAEGFVFYSNYESRKGKELEKNGHAALNFFWRELEKQVRIEGVVEKIDHNISAKYFNSRPFESRVSAIVSPQSQSIASREALEEKQKELLSTPDQVVCPAHWGGYRLRPDCIEFWQGRANRLHDRIVYQLNNGDWHFVRLAP
jgi:pyridoxamine 5'-phosphate oxidase